MRVERTNPAAMPEPLNGAYTHVVATHLGDATLLFVSGQLALDDGGSVVSPGDMSAQAERVFELISLALAAHHATLDDIVNLRTYVTDIDQRAAYGAVRTRRFSGDPPASTLVEVSSLAHPDAVLEVEAVAAIAADRDAAGAD